MNYDTIVIGAGLAGLMAAWACARRGERVLVLAKGPGSTHWAAGSVDLLNDTPLGDGPLAALDRLLVARPDHPYRLVGATGISEAFAQFRTLCADGGYPLAGNVAHTVQLPTAVGALRPTCLLPATMVAGDVRQWGDEPVLIAGFHELRDFFPPLIAANLRTQGYHVAATYLDLPPVGRRIDYSTATFARLFDRPDVRSAVARQLHTAAKHHNAKRVGLPAVLGFSHALRAIYDLQSQSGVLIFEIPTLPASIPGIRLFHLLEQALLRAGVRIQIGSLVLRGEGQQQHLAAIYSEAAAREQRHEAQRYILATGGILGGGLRADHTGTLHEIALNLPVHVPAPRTDWFNAQFLATAGHPVFRSGIAVDAQFRPLDADGQVVYHNVQVVGSALAGADPIREGCLEGLAIATGWASGERGT